MKSLDLFCASPASIAICSSIHHRTIVQPLNRLTHRLAHETPPKNRSNATYFPLDPSNPPSHPKPRKNISKKSAEQVELSRRKSSADVDDELANVRASLLSDGRSSLDVSPGSERAALASGNNKYSYCKRLSVDGFLGLSSTISIRSCDNAEYPVIIKSSPPISLSPSKKMSDCVKESLPAASNPQVVELRVSIHCKGCEGKLRKYISRMEGVRSFSIDLATKKVRVVGDVRPLDVLRSISKVKKAQFWSS